MLKIWHRRALSENINKSLNVRMKKLKLPIIKEALPAAKWLSMDDYVRFVSWNLRYARDKKTIRKQKRLSAVNVLFLLK